MFGDDLYDVSSAYPGAPLEEVLEALGRAVQQGKVRAAAWHNML